MKKISCLLVSALCCFFFFQSCTKEIPEKVFTIDDLTGYWNVYGLRDNRGPVPLEIVRIDRYGGDSLIAIKILGDNYVKTGMHLWKGKFTGKSFKVLWQSGVGGPTAYGSAGLTVENPDFIKESLGYYFFIRRTDGFNP